MKVGQCMSGSERRSCHTQVASWLWSPVHSLAQSFLLLPCPGGLEAGCHPSISIATPPTSEDSPPLAFSSHTAVTHSHVPHKVPLPPTSSPRVWVAQATDCKSRCQSLETLLASKKHLQLVSIPVITRQKAGRAKEHG